MSAESHAAKAPAHKRSPFGPAARLTAFGVLAIGAAGAVYETYNHLISPLINGDRNGDPRPADASIGSIPDLRTALPTNAIRNTPTATATLLFKASTETPLAPTPTPSEIKVPGTYLSESGKSYTGIMVQDMFSRRVVDNLNRVILVPEGNGWIEPKSEDSQPEFKAVFTETHMGHVASEDGVISFDLPITIGLTQSAIDFKDFPYDKIHFTQRAADDIASDYLHSCWYRYVNLMNHPGVTYDGYLKLLAEGKGNIPFVKVGERVNGKLQTKNVPILIDPRQGISTVLTYTDINDMPIIIVNTADTKFGNSVYTDKKGRLIATNNHLIMYKYMMGTEAYKNKISPQVRFMVGRVAGIFTDIAGTPESCLENGILSRDCQDLRSKIDSRTFAGSLYNDAWAKSFGKTPPPLFSFQ